MSTHGWIYHHDEETVKKFFEGRRKIFLKFQFLGLKIDQLFLHDLQGFNNNLCFIEFENEEVRKALEKDDMVVEGTERIIRGSFFYMQFGSYLKSTRGETPLIKK